MKPPTMKQLASEIDTYLKKFERDPKINKNTKPDRTGLSDYYFAGAIATTKVYVTYITYQGSTSLNRKQATIYLEWLKAGNVGRHWEAFETAGDFYAAGE